MTQSRAAAWAERQPLRVKLVAALISLLVLGLAVTGFAAWFAMRGYLVAQVDQNLVGAPASLVQDIRPALDNLGALTAGNCGGPGGRSPYAFTVQNSSGTWTCPATISTGCCARSSTCSTSIRASGSSSASASSWWAAGT